MFIQESWYFMLTINWRQVYEVNINNNTQWVLILYDISKNHYVGVPVYKIIMSKIVY